ncbi:hypothetical protein [Bradyrhizobium prioriisuperbiae]|uniref:hypothetical protein n=1 Tax=Bradyrhizobium prioriisuperbiae TaxID=2854389 RepID=UPI0028EB0EB6|nr:hypothetical protein [Bradyrhizobium prioritasuperba]
MTNRLFVLSAAMIALLQTNIAFAAGPSCRRDGTAVFCEDGRRGILSGESIIWSDGTRSSAATQHPSVIIGHKPSVHIGPGVFVGKGSGVVPLDDPNAPNKTRCAIIEGVSYCD